MYISIILKTSNHIIYKLKKALLIVKLLEKINTQLYNLIVFQIFFLFEIT